MTRRLTIGLVGAGIIGLLMSFNAWHSVSTQLKHLISSELPIHDRSVITALVEDSIHNPDVQQILHTQIMLFLKSPEGKAKLLEMMKSPEMIEVMAENLKTPELRSAISQLMNDPAFRNMLIGIVRNAPEMKLLRLLETEIEWNIPDEADRDEKKG